MSADELDGPWIAPLRILVFNWRDITHPQAGGAEFNLHEQAKRWVEAGHQVTVFTTQRHMDWRAPRREIVDGVEIIRRGGVYSVYAWAFVYWWFLFRGEYDVLLDISNGIPFYTPLYARLPKVVQIHHVHLKQWSMEFTFPLDRVGWLLERFVFAPIYRRTSLITVSRSTAELLRQVGVSPARAQIVYNGLDHRAYTPGLAASAPNPTIIYVGRIKTYKRLDILLRAVHTLLPDIPNLRLEIVGTGDQETRLRALAERLGITDHVRLHGFVSQERKIELLRGAWVFATPSMNEGWGLAVLEANACGVPAVGFHVPGIKEAIRHDETGLLAETDEQFADHLRTLLQDGALRQRMSQAAIEWAREFDWDFTAAETLVSLHRLTQSDQPAVHSYSPNGKLGAVPHPVAEQARR